MDKKIIKLLHQLQYKHKEFIHVRIYADESGSLHIGGEREPVFDFENKKELKKQLKKLLKE